MKPTTPKFIAHSLAITLASGIFSSAMAVETIKATVNGMMCDSCAQGMEKRLSHRPDIQAVYVNLKKKLVAVEAKEGQTLDAKALSAEITEAGYEVVKLETVAQSVAGIKASLKGVK